MNDCLTDLNNITVEKQEKSSIIIDDCNSFSVLLDDEVVEVITTDYEKLNNQPKINGVTLIGEKKSADLKLQEEMDTISNLDIDKLFS